MQYDFDEYIERRRTNSYKWDVRQNELPMWIADMDFDTVPVIKNAIQKRLLKGAFGYNIVPKSFQESVVCWWQKRHGFTM